MLAATRKSLSRYMRFVFGLMPAAHHLIWLRALKDLKSGDRLLIIAPPDHAKSTVVGLVWTSWLLANDPDHVHIGYVSNTARQANRESVAVRDLVAYSKRFHLLFPDVGLDEKKGTSENEWFLRRTDPFDKDASFQCSGIGGPLLGARLTHLVIDDPADPESMGTPYQREKCIEWLKMVALTRLEEAGIAVCILTRWHEEDPAGTFQKEGWKVMRMPAIQEDGTALWPARWSLEALQKIRDDPTSPGFLGSRQFAMMYQGEVMPEGGNVFKHEWFKYWKDPKEYDPHIRIVQSWDSVGENEVLMLLDKGMNRFPSFADFWDVLPGEVQKKDGREIKKVDETSWHVMGEKEFTGVKYISRHWFEGNLADVTTRTGRILVTFNHSLVGTQGNLLEPQYLEPRTFLPAPPWRHRPRSREQVRTTLFVGSTEFAWALGLFVAEGSTAKSGPKGGHGRQVSIANKNRALLERARQSLEAELHRPFGFRGPDRWGMSRLTCGWPEVTAFFEGFYDRNREKRVTDDLLNARDEVRKAFIAGYMAGDGYVPYPGMVDIATTSPLLAQELAWMFNELYGMRPRWYWRGDKRNVHRMLLGPHRQDSMTNAVRTVPYRGWVYDLETEDHVFRAGVGGILAHNTAFSKERTADYSVCSTWALTRSGHYLLDLYQKQVEFPQLKRDAVALWEKWNAEYVLVEKAASGQSLAQELRQGTHLPLLEVSPIGDKTARAQAVTPEFETGRVFFPRDAMWLSRYEHELELFPSGQHDDMVDSTTQYLNWVRGRAGRPRRTDEERRKESLWMER